MRRNLRRTLSLLLLALLLVSAVPLSSAVAEREFEIDEQGVLIKYNGDGGNVKIPNGVTKIGNNAFKNCVGLITVSIPKGVTAIGNQAFYGCLNLRKVNIPRGVTEIGIQAFLQCDDITAIVLPNTVVTIGEEAFRACYNLKKINIPKSVTTIGKRAFYYCQNLTDITIPKGVTEIKVETFAYCKRLNRISIPKGVETIGVGAFSYCERLTRVSIAEGVTEIGAQAFFACIRLARVSIPNTVTTIGWHAFSFCHSLAQVDMGNGVETIGMAAFERCRSLTDIVLPNSIRTIEEYAFASCSGLSSIVIPDGIATLAENAFHGCPNVRVVTIPKDMDEDTARNAFPAIPIELLQLPDDLLPPAIFLKVGQSMALPKFRGAKVKWSIEGNPVATGKGNKIRGVMAGDAMLRLTVLAAVKGKALTLNGQPLKPDKTYDIPLRVFAKGALTARKVTAAPKKMTLHPTGIDYPKKANIVPTFTPAALNEDDDWKGNCTYVSSNPRVAQVDNNGMVFAVRPGKAKITVYAPNMKAAKVSVTVKGFVTYIRMRDGNYNYVKRMHLRKGEFSQLIPEFNADAAFRVVRWTSSKPAVATVNGDGVVEALSKGTAKITATAMDGSRKKATVTVTVVGPQG
ncbi:MAG: leucine-rich repeat protein [Christensenellales bacterium]